MANVSEMNFTKFSAGAGKGDVLIETFNGTQHFDIASSGCHEINYHSSFRVVVCNCWGNAKGNALRQHLAEFTFVLTDVHILRRLEADL